MRPEIQAGLETALQHGGETHTLGDVVRQIMDGKAQYWESEGAAIITEIHDTPRMRLVHFWLATGELKEVISLSTEVLRWAESIGCKEASLAGRRGWQKVLASEGWKPRLVLMGRSINGE